MRKNARRIIKFSSAGGLLAVAKTLFLDGIYDSFVKNEYVDWLMLLNMIGAIILVWLMFISVTLMIEFNYIIDETSELQYRYIQLTEDYNKLNRMLKVENNCLNSIEVEMFRCMQKFIFDDRELSLKWYKYVRNKNKEDSIDGENN